MGSPPPETPNPFPLAGAIYIEYLTKRGHHISKHDSREALQRNSQPRTGHKLATYIARMDWLDSNYPLEILSRNAMDAICTRGVSTARALFKYFQGGYPLEKITVEAANETIMAYKDFWINYRSPVLSEGIIITQRKQGASKSQQKHRRACQDVERIGCKGKEEAGNEWEVIDDSVDEEWTDVAKEMVKDAYVASS